MGGRGINCAHSPTSRDYCTFTASGNRPRKTCGRFGPQKIRARAEAWEWWAPIYSGVPSRACVGRPFQLKRAMWRAGSGPPARGLASEPAGFRLQISKKLRREGMHK